MVRPGERPADFRVCAFNVIDQQTAGHHAAPKITTVARMTFQKFMA